MVGHYLEHMQRDPKDDSHNRVQQPPSSECTSNGRTPRPSFTTPTQTLTLNVFAAITVKLKLQENASSYLIGKGAFWLAVLFCLFIVFIYFYFSL